MPTKRIGRCGISLPELMVGIVLFGIITTSIGILIKTGLEYLRQAEERAELQRTSLFTLSRIGRELAESHSDAMRGPDPDEPPGIVYASPRSGGGVVYQNNHLLWQRVVGVYFDASKGLLLRTEEPLTPPTTFVPDLTPVGQDKSITHMVGLTVAGRSVLARNVSGFSATTSNGFRSVQMSLEVYTGEGARRSTLRTETGVVPNH